MDKQYKAVFFDWDGTAVTSRSEPPDIIAPLLQKLLRKGVQLAVISGTTYENIAGGRLHELFSASELEHLYFGLARGACNFRFRGGKRESFGPPPPDRETLRNIHRACFALHEHLFTQYGFPTDIVFSRPNYCKLDLLVGYDRSGQLFFHAGELELVNETLRRYGYRDGIRGLTALAEQIGAEFGLKLRATTDAKFLEVGAGTKSDNVDCIFEELGLAPGDCCFWGDEYLLLGDGIYGSDSFMRTDQTRDGDFFDVSDAEGQRPAGVRVLGGGVERFRHFLAEQADGSPF